MRNFDADIIAELAKEVAAAFWLVELQLTSTHYYSNCDIDLYSGGQTYQHHPLDIKEIHQGAGFNIDRVTVEFSNVGLAFSSLLLNEDASNKTAILSFVMLDSDAQIIDAAVEFFQGTIADWTLTERRATINLTTEFMLWRKKALRLPTPSCPWSFKGAECTYASSATWCDKSVERCKALSNYDNFGGRRYIAAIEDQKIYWGEK